MIAQADLITLGSNPKTWLVLIGGTLLSLVVGRFVQAFRNGAGLIDAGKAVLFGTNTPKGMPEQVQANKDNAADISAQIKP